MNVPRGRALRAFVAALLALTTVSSFARPARAQPPATPMVAAARTHPITSGFWVAAGLAGVSLTTAIVLDRIALGDLREYRRTPSGDLRDRGETTALVSDVSFGVAGITAAVAIAILVIDCSATRSGAGHARALPGGATSRGVFIDF